MNTYCPNCQQPFTFANPPKKLKNCEHNICDSCLPTTIKCALDNKRIEFRRYTANAFKIDHELLDQIEKNNQQLQKKMKTNLHKQTTPKRQYQMCLLHSKVADLICCMDGQFICANCALFGQHKGHNIKNCEDFFNSLTGYTQQALEIFDKLKQKQENLNEEVIANYIEDCFKEQRDKQAKNIKIGFTKLIQKIKKAQKASISKLDNQIIARKQALLKDVCTKELQIKKNDWYNQVELLGNITQNAYQFQNIEEALRYLDETTSESFLLKRGQYLHLQYCSSEDVIKNKIDSQVAKLTVNFNKQIDKIIEEYCSFVLNTEKAENSISNIMKQSTITQGEINCEEDILIQQISARSHLSNSIFQTKDLYLRQEMQSKIGYGVGIRIPEVNLTESILPPSTQTSQKEIGRQRNERSIRSRSIKQKSITEFVPPIYRQALGPVQNKKKRKIDIPEKYKQAFEDLKNDKCEVIDFGGAELGDYNVLALCQYIEKTSKLRNLKLVRNKISDDSIKQLLNACYHAKVTSLNLGQNLLTQKSLEIFESFDLGDLRNITLSLNKINRRNVKEKLDGFAKRGITLSI